MRGLPHCSRRWSTQSNDWTNWRPVRSLRWATARPEQHSCYVALENSCVTTRPQTKTPSSTPWPPTYHSPLAHRPVSFCAGAWREFGSPNALQGSENGVGLNYLEICDHVRGDSSSEAPLVAEGIRSVLHGGKKSFSIEYPCHPLAGQRWFQLVVTPLHDDRLLGVVVMHLDISERKQGERSAQLNQKRLRDLLDGLGPSIFVGLMTPQGILIEVNRPALAAVGLKPQDL